MKVPVVSVVMSVYNGEQFLRQSVESILAQEFADFEFIIINDGSKDCSRDILAEYERQDSRVRVIDQENRGLTKALIRGCAEACGRYIARQDSGDVSLPGRLVKQVRYLDDHPEIALLSCWTTYIGPEDEELECVVRHDTPEEATSKLRCRDAKKIQGVSHHGSTMFRRADYERVGGYRPQFYCAQDMDLWNRLTDSGMLAFIPDVLYQARIEPHSISMKHFASQVELSRIIVQLRERREHGEDESDLLRRAECIRPRVGSRSLYAGAGYYFLGRLLQQKCDPRATRYLRLAVQASPFWPRARLALTRDLVRVWFERAIEQFGLCSKRKT